MGTEKTNLDFGIEQDDVPFTLNDDDVEVNFSDEDLPAPSKSPLRGQNEEFQNADDDGNFEDNEDGLTETARSRIAAERRQASEQARVYQQHIEMAENAALEGHLRSAAAQRDSFKIGLDALDEKMKTARQAYAQAKSDGDISSEVEIQAAIDNIRQLRQQIEQNLSQLPSDQQIQRSFQETRARLQGDRARFSASANSDVGQPLNDLARQWADRNSWMNDGSKKEEKEALVQISSQLAREGLDPKDPEHFTELTRRMAKSFPQLGVRDMSGRQLGAQARGQPQTNQRRASNPPPVGGNRGALPGMQKAKNGKLQVTLDPSDRAMMRQLRLDPSDVKVAARFAREKAARLQRDQRSN